jgi:hypothetical protein
MRRRVLVLMVVLLVGVAAVAFAARNDGSGGPPQHDGPCTAISNLAHGGEVSGC